MRRISAVSLSLAAMLAATASSRADEGTVRLAPHRVVYDLTLAKSSGTRSVESARGRIALEFGGDACEGYTTKYRQVTVLESGETGSRTSDLRNTTFESGDGKSFHFKTESLLDGKPKQGVDGEAEAARDGTIQVRLKKPKRETAQLPAALFPTEHMKRLIRAARAGERLVTEKVFDGSEDGKRVYDTLAVIGSPIEPGKTDGVETASQQDALVRMTRWPVTLSYFAPGEGERTPVYVLSFELYDNGISRALRLDYGDFALKGDIKSLDLLPESTCQR